MISFGNVPAGSVLPIMFTSYAGATGASVTMSGLAVTDIEVYKGTSMTQRASDAGFALLDTDGIDIDSTTGLHGFSIDLGDNTDSGFYTVGSFYTVVVSAVTIDSQTVTFIAATFRIVAAESSAGTPKVDVSHFGGTAGNFASGRPEVNTTHIAGTAWASTTLFTLASHDPGATLGTSTLTQSQVTGGAYALNSASFAFNAALDLTTTQKASVNTEADAALSDVGVTTTVTGRIDAAVSSRLASAGYTAPPSAASVADAVWDEALSGHLTAGSTGEALNAAGAAGDPWTTSLPGAYSAGQAGYIVGTTLNATISSRASQASVDVVDAIVDAILLDTAEIGAAGAGLTALPWNAAWDAEVQSEVADALAVYDPPTHAELTAAIDAVPTATENADALLNRDMSAVSDTNSRTPLNALRFLRNKWSLSGTTLTVTQEDDSTAAWTATVTTNAAADPITGSDPA